MELQFAIEWQIELSKRWAVILDEISPFLLIETDKSIPHVEQHFDVTRCMNHSASTYLSDSSRFAVLSCLF